MSKLYYDNGKGEMVRAGRRVPWRFVNALVELRCWVLGCDVEEIARNNERITVSCRCCHRTTDIPVSIRFELRR